MQNLSGSWDNHFPLISTSSAGQNAIAQFSIVRKILNDTVCCHKLFLATIQKALQFQLAS